MKYTSLDSIVCSILINKGYPHHYYFQFLKLASDCLRELNFHTLKNIRTTTLYVNDYRAADLPEDYVDYVKIGIPSGQFVRPYGEKDSISRLKNYDSSGTAVEYGTSEINDGQSGWYGYWYHNTINDNGEFNGRSYGIGEGDRIDSFKILPERNQIQFHEGTIPTYIILEYISDGLESDNATQVNPYAQATIEAYIHWKSKEFNRSYNLSEREIAKDEYYNELRHLRARIAGWTVTDILRAIRSSYIIKT